MLPLPLKLNSNDVPEPNQLSFNYSLIKYDIQYSSYISPFAPAISFYTFSKITLGLHMLVSYLGKQIGNRRGV
jgi:hypothetical protein